MRRFDGRRALVTGAARGIGRAIARRLATEGAIVTIVDINAESGEATVADIVAAGGSATFVDADITDDAAVARALDTAVDDSGVLDVLVNNAQYFPMPKALELVSVKDWELTEATGPKAAFRLMQLALPYLRESGHGAVVNMTSGAGLNGIKYTGAYAAAKGSMLSLSKVAANEWAKYNVRVNAVSPFATSDEQRSVTGSEWDLHTTIASASPLGRSADFDRELAPSVAYLASDDAGAVTGTVLYVDCGLTELSTIDYSHFPGIFTP